jgi:hypothetical protein
MYLSYWISMNCDLYHDFIYIEILKGREVLLLLFIFGFTIDKIQYKINIELKIIEFFLYKCFIHSFLKVLCCRVVRLTALANDCGSTNGMRFADVVLKYVSSLPDLKSRMCWTKIVSSLYFNNILHMIFSYYSFWF